MYTLLDSLKRKTCDQKSFGSNGVPGAHGPGAAGGAAPATQGWVAGGGLLFGADAAQKPSNRGMLYASYYGCMPA